MWCQVTQSPKFKIGDNVQGDLYSECTIARFGKGCVYFKTSKRKEGVFKDPDSLTNGSIKKL